MQVDQVHVFVQVLLVAVDGDFAQLQLFLLRLEAARLQSVDAQHLALLQREAQTLETANKVSVFNDSKDKNNVSPLYSDADRADDPCRAPSPDR